MGYLSVAIYSSFLEWQIVIFLLLQSFIWLIFPAHQKYLFHTITANWSRSPGSPYNLLWHLKWVCGYGPHSCLGGEYTSFPSSFHSHHSGDDHLTIGQCKKPDFSTRLPRMPLQQWEGRAPCYCLWESRLLLWSSLTLQRRGTCVTSQQRSKSQLFVSGRVPHYSLSRMESRWSTFC